MTGPPGSLTPLSKLLWTRLFTAFPEWENRAELIDAEYESNGSTLRSVYVQVPSPADKSCYLSIWERGDCIEISFSDGDPPGPAEEQITCTDGADLDGVVASIDFVREIIEERTMIFRTMMLWPLIKKAAPPQFANSDGFDKSKPSIVRIVSWRGKHNLDRRSNSASTISTNETNEKEKRDANA